MKKKSKIKTKIVKTLCFEDIHKFKPETRYLLHLKNGTFKFAFYFDLNYLKKVNPNIAEISKEELKNTPKSYFLTEGHISTYCLMEDIESVYSISNFKCYKSNGEENQ